VINLDATHASVQGEGDRQIGEYTVNKRLSIFMLAAGAAGTMLLTACGQAGSTTEARDGSDRSAKVNNVANSEDSVDCGEVDLEDLGYHKIWADQGAGGAVDCAETYDVTGEYLRIPVEERNAAGPDDVRLAGGWACGIDDTGGTSLHCYKGEVGNATEFTFHTVPAETVDTPTEDKTTDCGEFDVDDTGPHTVMADWLGKDETLVSCTEAFNVLTEYLSVPIEERNSATASIPLSDGWECAPDGSSRPGISCSQGDISNTTGMLHTIPVNWDEPVDCGEVQVTDSITHNLVADGDVADIVGCVEAQSVLDSYLAIPIEERDPGVGFDNIQVSDGWACGTYDGESMTITCGKDKVHGKFGTSFHTEPV
jgi:hypothetical protein